MPLEKRTFEKGMNQDLAESLMSPGMYRYALNIRNGNSERGAVGVITNAEGNQEFSVTLPAGGNRVIGAYDDEAHDRVIYIVHNTGGNNRIFAYNYEEGVVQTVVSDSNNVLDLNVDYLVTAINVVADQSTEYLLFTDNYGEPKNIDIQAGIRTYDTAINTGLYTYRKFLGDFDTVSPTTANKDDVYSREINIKADNGFLSQIELYYRAKTSTTQNPTSSTSSVVPQSNWEFCPSGYIYGKHTEESFNNIVKPPRQEPIFNITSNGGDYNYLFGNLFQFKIKYVRADGRESSWSPITPFIDLYFPSDSLLNIINYSNIIKINNTIKINVPIPNTSIYKTVKIAVRRNMNDNSPSDWQLAGTVDLVNLNTDIGKEVDTVGESFVTPFNYDGTQALMPLDTNDATQLMSWIPRKAKAQSITSRNRILYSNFTEGLPINYNDENSIVNKPPVLRFFERDNPFRTSVAGGRMEVYEIDSTDTISADSIYATAYSNGDGNSVFEANGVIAPAVSTAEMANYPSVTSGLGLAFKFPSTIEVGDNISISFTINYNYSGGVISSLPTQPAVSLDDPTIYNPSQFPNINNRHKVFKKSKNIVYVADSTTVTDMIDLFVSNINNDHILRVNELFNSNWNTQLCTASSANSGGDNYLIIKPTPRIKKTVLGYNTLAALVDCDVYLQSYFQFYPDAEVGRASRAVQSFKRGSNHQFGIVYSDDYGRLSTVIESPGFNTQNPWWKDTVYFVDQETKYKQMGQRFLKMTLSHDAPSWATRYHIVKTNSNGIRRHISFPISVTDSLSKVITSSGESNPFENKFFIRGYLKPEWIPEASGLSASAGSLAGVEYIYINLNSLQSSQYGYTNLSDTDLAYDFVKGDRVRFCYKLTNTSQTATTGIPFDNSQYFTSNAEAEIVKYIPEINAIAIRVNDLPTVLTNSTGLFAAANSAGTVDNDIFGLMCEIYTPIETTIDSFYYEMYTDSLFLDGTGTRKLHNGNITNQGSSNSCEIELTNGDVFLKPRTYVIYYSEAATADSQSVIYFVEDANYYDTRESKSWGAGRPNRSIRSTSLEEDITGFVGESVRPTTIRYSEPLLPEQGYNGLGTVHDLNFKDANGAMKSIQHMHTEGSKTIVFHENAVGVAESDRAVVTTLDENNMTIGANTPVSDVVYYGTRAGIGTNPESFANSNNRKYFVDIDQGQVCRLSQDGVTPISDAGMDKYFKEVFRDMIKSPQVDYAFGAYDKRTDEYTLNLKWTDTISVTQAGGATFTGSPTFTVQYTADISTYDYYIGQSLVVEGQNYTDDSLVERQGFAPTSVYVSNVSGSTITLQFTEEQWNNSNFTGQAGARRINVYAFKSITLTYSEKTKSWTSFHSYVPENITSAGLDFVSFKAGKLYTHDDYNNPMSYYGVDYPSYIDIISNMGGDQVKIWKTMALKATTDDAEVVEADFLIPVSSADTTGSVFPISGGVEDSRGKLSTGTTFVSKENQLYSEYMRTGTGTDYTGYIEGDKVRGYWVYTRFKINSGISKIYKIISASFDFLMSNYTR